MSSHAGGSVEDTIDGFRAAVAVVSGMAVLALLVSATGLVGGAADAALEPADA